MLELGSITLVWSAFFVAQVGIVPCPCCQPIHWPVHACSNHENVHATNSSIGQCIHAQTMITSMPPAHLSMSPALVTVTTNRSKTKAPAKPQFSIATFCALDYTFLVLNLVLMIVLSLVLNVVLLIVLVLVLS